MLSVVAISALAPAAAWALPRELLPNLVQRVPYQVAVHEDPDRPGRVQLVFASSVDNYGPGPLIVDARRPSGADTMVASQTIRSADGSERTGAVDGVGEVYYDQPHDHWHLRAFERYELRSADGRALVAPDSKSGFCLGDRYRAVTDFTLPGQPPASDPALTTDCHRGDTGLQAIREGISVGYGDDYAAGLEGQSIDVTDVPDGTYVLVHRVDPAGRLRQADRSDDASSVRLTLTRPAAGAVPAVRVVASCFLAPSCDRARRPQMRRRPRVTQRGRTLTCDPGRWSRGPVRTYVQWVRGGYPRPGATAPTYRLAADEGGRPFRCRVTAANAHDSAVATSPEVTSRP